MASEDETVLIGSQVGQGVERVGLEDELVRCLNKPRIHTFCQVLKGSHQLLPKVLAPTQPPPPQSCIMLEEYVADACQCAYQIEVVRGRVNNSEALLSNTGSVSRRDPDPRKSQKNATNDKKDLTLRWYH